MCVARPLCAPRPCCANEALRRIASPSKTHTHAQPTGWLALYPHVYAGLCYPGLFAQHRCQHIPCIAPGSDQCSAVFMQRLSINKCSHNMQRTEEPRKLLPRIKNLHLRWRSPRLAPVSRPRKGHGRILRCYRSLVLFLIAERQESRESSASHLCCNCRSLARSNSSGQPTFRTDGVCSC